MGREGQAISVQPRRIGKSHAYDPGIREVILDRLAQGDSLTEICVAEGMPDRKTVQRWLDGDSAFDVAASRARETGFAVRAERTMAEVRDLALVAPNAGRLLLDSERWYLGKMSAQFSDNKPTKVEVDVELSVEALAWFGRAERSSNG